jgi:hypothetical protein
VQRMGRVLRRKPAGRFARFVIVFVEQTVEDPALGAHGQFLHEVTDVAESVVSWRTSNSESGSFAEVCEFIVQRTAPAISTS